VKKQRQRWEPSSEQLATIVDCSVARMPLERTAELIGVWPRTLRSFSRRVEAAREVRAENTPKGGMSA
jgi:hypothetical protein